MTAYEDNIVQIKARDLGEALRHYQGMGCSLWERSGKGAFLDCSASVGEETYFDFETARDEVWHPGEVQQTQRYEADASTRDYYC